MKSSFKILWASASLVAAMSAQAAPVDLGDISGAENLAFEGVAGTTEFTFNWLANDGAGDLIATFRVSRPAPITSVTFDSVLVPIQFEPGAQYVSLFSGVLSRGAHSFVVQARGVFAGTIATSPVDSGPGGAVPESESLALALAGLSVMGLLVRRRARH